MKTKMCTAGLSRSLWRGWLGTLGQRRLRDAAGRVLIALAA